MQKDFQHLREWRLLLQGAKSNGLKSFSTLLIGAILTAMWIGLQEMLHK
jgi:hypothetical protein